MELTAAFNLVDDLSIDDPREAAFEISRRIAQELWTDRNLGLT